MSILHVVSVSGGKDSAATLLIALERFGRHRVIPIFCDTGNEHEAVYEYLDYLELALEIKITRLKSNFDREIANKRMFIARDRRTGRKNGKRLRWTNKAKRRALAVLHPTGNPYLDLCLWKGRFPSRKAQFCTEFLKRNPAVEFQLSLQEQGHTVVSWQGIRRNESLNRRNAKKFECIGPGFYTYRPIVDWTAAEVFAYCGARGIKANPLYLQGMNRVGCMPCINLAKEELRQIATRFPDHIARIQEWELMVSMSAKRGFATFLHKSDGKKQNDQQIFENTNIIKMVDWSNTTRGGKQFNLLADLDDIHACASSYGLCE